MYIIMGTVPEIIPAATLLPWFGFFLGFIIAYLPAQLGKKKAVTVGIETGYQNPSIPIIMLQGNFVQPEGDLGAVMPIATALFTQIPLLVYYIYLEIRARSCKGMVGGQEKDVEEQVVEEGHAVEAGCDEQNNVGYVNSHNDLANGTAMNGSAVHDSLDINRNEQRGDMTTNL